jgi:hypothetical protein
MTTHLEHQATTSPSSGRDVRLPGPRRDLVSTLPGVVGAGAAASLLSRTALAGRGTTNIHHIHWGDPFGVSR